MEKRFVFRNILCLCLLVTLLVSFLPVNNILAEYAAETYGVNVVFHSDFDNVNAFGTNVSIKKSDYGNGAEIKYAENFGGADFSVKQFTFCDSTAVKFDIKSEGSQFNFALMLFDDNKRVKTLKINSDDVNDNTWYTYVADLGSYTAYRCEKGGSIWEKVNTNEFVHTNSDDKKNTISLTCEGSAEKEGNWLIDNISVYKELSASVIKVPTDMSASVLKPIYTEDFQDSPVQSHFGWIATFVKESADSENVIADFSVLSNKDYSVKQRTDSFLTPAFDIPKAKDGYNISFDFRMLEVLTDEYLQVIARQSNLRGESALLKIPASNFEKGVWYNVSFSVKGDGVTEPKINDAKLVNKNTKEEKSLVYEQILYANNWSSQEKNIVFTMYNPGASAENPIADRNKLHYQFDNVTCSVMCAPSIDGELLVKSEQNPDYTDDFQNNPAVSDYGYLVTFVPKSAGDEDVVVNYSLNLAGKDYSKTQGAFTFITKTFEMPSAKRGYTISFDFCRVDDATEEYLRVITRCDVTKSESAITQIPISIFEKDVWYTVEYTISGDGVAEPKISGESYTNKSTLQKTDTQFQLIDFGQNWTSHKNVMAFRVFNFSASESTPVANRDKIHYQFDNIKCYQKDAPTVDTSLLTEGGEENILPLLGAYDENGVLLGMAEGKHKEQVGTFEINLFEKKDTFLNAKYVKAFLFDGYQNMSPYCIETEIGDALASESGKAIEKTETITITDDMQPVQSDVYGAFAYTVPLITNEYNIPSFNSSEHTPLALWQQKGKITSLKYDATLYDETKQDIVLVVGGMGADAKITLIEKNPESGITNITMMPGSDTSKRNFTWFSLSSEAGYITFAKESDMTNGQFPADAQKVAARRDHPDSEYSLKEFYYNNKAEIEGLEFNTKYCYQLSNGIDKSEIYSFITGDNSGRFSFAFGGDAQIGGRDDGATLADESEVWGRTLKQITTADEFEGIEFFVSAGDQVDSSDGDTPELDERQYDVYINQEEFKSLAQVVVLGNHDVKTRGRHYQHFNQPNISDEAGYQEFYNGGQLFAPSGKKDAYIQSADYYFVYNSALFIVINNNDFVDNDGTKEKRAEDKKAADRHGAFIKKAIEETRDNSDIMWKIVLYHRSPYGSSYHGNYTKDSSTGIYKRLEQYAYINIREYLMPYLYENGIDIVLSGHDHCYTRTHIIKPDANAVQQSVITPYKNTSVANFYTYADNTNAPKFVSWTDREGIVFDGVSNPYLKVLSKPLKVTDPDGILHVAGGSSSGSQVNAAEFPNHHAAETLVPESRHMSRIDISPTSLTLLTYNLGTNQADDIKLVDEFTIEKTFNTRTWEEDGSLKVRLGVQNGGNKRAFVAAYNKQGDMLSVGVTKLDAQGDGVLAVEKNSDATDYKAYIWQDNLVPIVKSITVE